MQEVKKPKGGMLMVVLILLLALFAAPTCAVAGYVRPDPSTVLLVVNPLSTLDTDNNGVPDWHQIMVAYRAAHPGFDTVAQVCSVATSDCKIPDTCTTDCWKWESVVPFEFHYAIDTSSVYDIYGKEVNKPGNYDYILQKIGAHLTANNQWHSVKYIATVMGMPLRVMNPARPMPHDVNGECVTQWMSLDDVLMTYLHEGIEDDAINFIPQGRRFNTYAYYCQTAAVWPDSIKGFRAPPPAGCSRTDTVTLSMFVTRLDGYMVTDVLRMIGAARTPMFPYNPTTSDWSTENVAVIDNCDTCCYRSPCPTVVLCDISVAPWIWNDGMWPYTPAFPADTFRAAIIRSFGFGQIVRDSIGGDGNGLTYPAKLSTRFGYELGVDDSILFYHSSGNYAGLPAEHDWTQPFKVAHNAMEITNESYSCLSMRDSSLRFSPRQSHAAEAIANGYAYSIGHVWEPLGSGAVTPLYAARAFSMSGITFGQFAVVCRPYLSWESCALGDPLGIVGRDVFYPDELSVTWRRFGGCAQRCDVSFAIPNDDAIDSLYMYVLRESAVDSTYALAVTPDQQIIRTFGWQWGLSSNIDEIQIVLSDTLGNNDTTRIMP